jgi:hypothetical protein
MRRRVWSAVATMRAREAVSSACAWAFAIAVATSSVKSARRASVSAGSGSGRAELTPISPHSRPSTVIGHPTVERTPSWRATSASGLEGG